MARHNSLRSWLSASLLMFSGVVGVLMPPSPAGAAAPRTVEVWLHDTYFEAPNGSRTPTGEAVVYAKPYQWIIFRLVNPQNRHRTVTVDPVHCAGQPEELCDKAFDDPNVDRDNPIVRYRWATEGEYDFSDRYSPAVGRFIISSSDQTVPPSNTTTTSSSTTTTTLQSSTTTTLAPTTSTTAPTSVRPFLVPDPAPTTTTTVAANLPAPPTTAPANKDKPKGKKKAASPATPTTAAPAPPDTMPPDFIFDPAALTPGPTLMPDGSATDSGDEAAISASAAASLLDPQKADDDNVKLVLMALAALAVLLLVGGGWAWFTRASRYDPA